MRALLVFVAVALTLAATQVCVSASRGASVCPYPCQNGGTCVSSVCQCKGGFVGIDCTRRGCASNCNHRGYCDLSSSPPSCLCFPGFGGLECELTTSSTTTTTTTTSTTTTSGSGSSSTSTGNSTTTTNGSGSTSSSTNGTIVLTARPIDRTICNPPCHAANGVCWQGACACADGFTGPTCTDRLCPDDCSYRGKCHKDTGECECYRPYSGKTCAGASETVVPRLVDTMDDVHGPDNVTESEKTNRVNRAKKGQSNAFHLIEQASQMQMEDVQEYTRGLDE